MNRTTGDSHHSPKNKKNGSRQRQKWRQKGFNKGFPPGYKRSHIDPASVFPSSEREAEERPFDSAARANLHEKRAARNPQPLNQAICRPRPPAMAAA